MLTINACTWGFVAISQSQENARGWLKPGDLVELPYILETPLSWVCCLIIFLYTIRHLLIYLKYKKNQLGCSSHTFDGYCGLGILETCNTNHTWIPFYPTAPCDSIPYIGCILFLISKETWFSKVASPNKSHKVNYLPLYLWLDCWQAWSRNEK